MRSNERRIVNATNISDQENNSPSTASVLQQTDDIDMEKMNGFFATNSNFPEQNGAGSSNTAIFDQPVGPNSNTVIYFLVLFFFK